MNRIAPAGPRALSVLSTLACGSDRGTSGMNRSGRASARFERELIGQNDFDANLVAISGSYFQEAVVGGHEPSCCGIFGECKAQDVAIPTPRFACCEELRDRGT